MSSSLDPARDGRTVARGYAAYYDDRGRAIVSGHFGALLFGPTNAANAVAPAFDLESLWDPQRRLPALREAVQRIGIADADGAATLLAQWLESGAVQRLEDVGRKRLQTLIPRLLERVRDTAEQTTALARVMRVLEAVGGRSAYFALLNENRAALERALRHPADC